MSATAEALIAEYAAAPTSSSPPPSLLTPISSPLPHIPSPLLPVTSPPTTSPTYVEAPLGYKAAEIREDVPEADVPPWKRLCLTAPTSRFEIWESLAAVAARQPGSSVARRVDYGFMDTVDSSIQAAKERAMTADHPNVDRATVRAEIEDANDRATRVMMRIHVLEDRAHIETLEDTGSIIYDDDDVLCYVDITTDEYFTKMPPKRTVVTTTPTPMTDAQIKTLIAQGVADALAEIKANRTSINGDDNYDSGTGSKRIEQAARECTYSDFLKCQPLNFKGTEGVVSLTQWFEKMESIFHISNCTVACQIKFATCTLLGSAQTWWNSHVKIIKKLEIELWNLKVKGTDVLSYSQHFQELELMCLRMFLEESNEVKKYVGGLPDMIQGSVMASKPKIMQDAIEHNVAKAYTAGPGEKKVYGGSRPMCRKFNYHHEGQCVPRCNKCKKVGHLARDCRGAADNTNTQRGVTCYECGVQGHYKKDCPKLKNKNRGNQAGISNVVARAYVVGMAGTNPKSNVVMGTFLLNNCYASILFDTGADRSFVSTAFSSLIDIVSTTLDHGYDVELADGKIIELGGFDVKIGMDWLTKYHAVIICDEKLVCLPFGSEILIFHGDRSNNGHESRLNIISCTKTQKYLLKGCHVFLAHITTKKAEDKSEEKQLKDVPIVQDFPEVFPKDLPGISPARQVEFQIDLVPSAAWAPYQLAPSKMKELSDQLQELSDKGFIRPSSSPWGAPVLFVKKKDV
ncbi:putative reverse transcriptase domain-containing protein [Tanacetum coccineum]